MIDIKTAQENINKNIATYEARLNLWRSVKRVSKKDGADFQSIGKNFTGADYKKVTYSIRADYEIRVSGRVNGVWIEDSIDCAPVLRYYKKDVDESRVIKESFLEPYFFMTVDEIMDAIADRIALLEGYIKEEREQARLLEDVFGRFTYEIDNALQAVKDTAGARSSIYYSCIEYMKSKH